MLALPLQDSIRDKLRPITVTLAYGIQGAGTPRHSRSATLPPLPPVLSPQQPSSHRTEVRGRLWGSYRADYGAGYKADYGASYRTSYGASSRCPIPSCSLCQVHFLKQGCGDDKICQSNLQLRFQFCTRLGDADFLPLPK